ncbi:MAG: alcohol dehydrogenase catalytic domain-containing protein, partial [Planctomycetota bacterium]
MRAATLLEDKTFQIADVTPPGPKAGQVQVEVAWCGICGTDMHIFHGSMDKRVPFPMVIGHEASAVVSALGDG